MRYFPRVVPRLVAGPRDLYYPSRDKLGVGDKSVRCILRYDDAFFSWLKLALLAQCGSGLMQSFTVVACHASAAWSGSEFRILINILQQATDAQSSAARIGPQRSISAGFHFQLADKGGLIQQNEYNQRQKRGNEHSIAPVIRRLMRDGDTKKKTPPPPANAAAGCNISKMG